jgi:hypothetical protein
MGSASKVVWLALEQFDLGAFEPARDPHRRISVRIAGKQWAALRHAAKRTDASIGELIRAALEQLPAMPARRRRLIQRDETGTARRVASREMLPELVVASRQMLP